MSTPEDLGGFADAAFVPNDDSLEDLVSNPSRLKTRWLGREGAQFVRRVDSTNEALGKLAREQKVTHGHLLVADSQRYGRGRRGRVWISPPGLNLYFSVLIRPEWSPKQVPPLSLAAAVGVAHGLSSSVGVSALLKWPNDLFLEDRKMGGILVEVAASPTRVHHVIIGIGLNINQLDFDAKLGKRATSVRQVLGAHKPLARGPILLDVLVSLERVMTRLLDGAWSAIAEEWQTMAAGWLGRRVMIETATGRLEGVAAGIDHDGALLLRDSEDIERRIVSGTVL